MITAFSRDHAYAQAIDILRDCRTKTGDEQAWNTLLGATSYLLKQWQDYQNQRAVSPSPALLVQKDGVQGA